MTPYSKDYIVPGDIFPDETVLCMRCGTTIMRLSYKEVPKINNPTETVNIAHKMKLGNYRLFPVVLYRKEVESVVSMPVCQDCVKMVEPSPDSDHIIGQIKRAMQIEARWIGMPEEVIDGINSQFADAKIVRKLNVDEVIENRILEGV